MKAPEKLYEGNIRKKYLLFAIPLILSALLSQSYNFINSIMIGKFIGSEGFAATAVTAQLIDFANSILYGYLAGVGIYVSVLFGKSQYQKVLNVIKINFIITSSFAILLSLVSNIFCAQIFDILNVNDEVYQNAELYFRAYMSGMLFFQFNWGFTYIANGMGITKMPLFASVVTGIINVLLNYIFLAVLGKGIGYSALATVIATAITTAFYFAVYIRLFKEMHIRLGGLDISKEDIKNSLSYSTPTMFQQAAMTSCTAIISPLVNTCSTAALSGYSVASKARTLLCAVYQESSKANTTLIAQAMGARRLDKIKQGTKVGITQGLIFFAVTLGLFMVFAKQFTALFLDPVKDAQSFAISVNTIRFLFPFILFNVFNNLFHGIFRAVGSGMLMFVSTLIYAVSFVIYAYILLAVLPEDLRIYGVTIGLSLAYITEVTFATIIFIVGKWKTPEYKEIEREYELCKC